MTPELLNIILVIASFAAGSLATFILKKPSGTEILATFIQIANIAVEAAEQAMIKNGDTSRNMVKAEVGLSINNMANELGIKVPSDEIVHATIESAVHRMNENRNASLIAAVATAKQSPLPASTPTIDPISYSPLSQVPSARTYQPLTDTDFNK